MCWLLIILIYTDYYIIRQCVTLTGAEVTTSPVRPLCLSTVCFHYSVQYVLVLFTQGVVCVRS